MQEKIPERGKEGERRESNEEGKAERKLFRLSARSSSFPLFQSGNIGDELPVLNLKHAQQRGDNVPFFIEGDRSKGS